MQPDVLHCSQCILAEAHGLLPTSAAPPLGFAGAEPNPTCHMLPLPSPPALPSQAGPTRPGRRCRTARSATPRPSRWRAPRWSLCSTTATTTGTPPGATASPRTTPSRSPATTACATARWRRREPARWCGAVGQLEAEGRSARLQCAGCELQVGVEGLEVLGVGWVAAAEVRPSVDLLQRWWVRAWRLVVDRTCHTGVCCSLCCVCLEKGLTAAPC